MWCGYIVGIGNGMKTMVAIAVLCAGQFHREKTKMGNIAIARITVPTAGRRWTEGRTLYEELVKRLRADADYMDNNGIMLYAAAPFYRECADAIEELSRQRDRAYARLCEWCGVCPEGKRNAEDCEIAALNQEPPKEET